MHIVERTLKRSKTFAWREKCIDAYRDAVVDAFRNDLTGEMYVCVHAARNRDARTKRNGSD